MSEQNIKYIKSFSKGQITIPREVRKSLQLKDESWYKLYTVDRKVVLEPIAEKPPEEYAESLLEIDTTWFNEAEWKQLRKSSKKRQDKYSLD